MKLSINSTSKLSSDTYSVEFCDGILLVIKYTQGSDTWSDVGPMCSLGVDSYYIKKGRFPSGNNLRKRLVMGTDMIKSRINRYKKKENTDVE
jgi:hypothetical protein